MNSYKKAVANTVVLGLIMLAVTVVVYLAIVGRNINTKPIEECRGTCVNHWTDCSNLGGTITSNRCIKGGELQKGVCCVTVDDISKKEPTTPTETTPPTTSELCNTNDYPIHYSQDAGFRYKCLENNQAQACRIQTNTIIGTFSACSTQDKNHPVYKQCCLEETQPGTDPETTQLCNETQFPITEISDPYKYVCQENKQAQACRITDGAITKQFDACQVKQEHKVYIECCRNEPLPELMQPIIPNPVLEVPSTLFEPKITVKLGEDANIDLPESRPLITGSTYDLTINSYGLTKTCRTRLYYLDTGATFNSITMDANKEITGNCKNLKISLEPTTQDLEKLGNDYLLLKIDLFHQVTDQIMHSQEYMFSIINLD